VLVGYFGADTIINQMRGYPGVAAVDEFDVYNNAAPSLAQMQSYDSVVTVGSANYKDRVALGNALAGYIDAGGVVVQTGVDWLEGYYLQGSWQTKGYSPFTAPHDAEIRTVDYLGARDSAHPLMQGVNNLTEQYKTNVTLNTGATQVAAYQTGKPLVAFKWRVVAINGDVSDQTGAWSGDFYRVIINATNWVRGYNCPAATATHTATGTPPTSTATPSPMPPTPTPRCGIQYSDVPSDSPFYAYIECLACRGVMTGYGDGTFRPNNLLTRGQLSKIVAQAADWGDPPMYQTYTDVKPGDPFYNYVERLSARGVISGYPCGGAGEACDSEGRPYFRPNTPASRGQLSKIVANTAGFSEDPGEQIFSDVAPGSPFYEYVNRLTQRGVMSGYPCGGAGEACDAEGRPYFRPNFNVTRGQAAKIVSNTFFPGCKTET
jgi:hypothetical protein